MILIQDDTVGCTSPCASLEYIPQLVLDIIARPLGNVVAWHLWGPLDGNSSYTKKFWKLIEILGLPTKKCKTGLAFGNEG